MFSQGEIGFIFHSIDENFFIVALENSQNELFVETRAECQHNTVDDAIGQCRKDWKGVSAQAVVIFNSSFDNACLNFEFLRNITASCFQSYPVLGEMV